MRSVQHSLGYEEVAGCRLAQRLCNACLRSSVGTRNSLRTQESHRSRLRQSAQVCRHRCHDNDDIPRQKVPLIA